MKIMLVDDNFRIREVIRQIIEEECAAKCSFLELNDGEEVISAYSAFSPDWVFMDIKMPKVDGLTASRQLLEHFPAARVVFVSQYSEAVYREAARQIGAFAYILKDNLLDIPVMINNVIT